MTTWARRRGWTWVMMALWVGGTAPAAHAQVGRSEARALVDAALDLMGGEDLRVLTRVRLDMMTQWQRTSFRGRPWTDRPSFEHHVDVRDYSIPAWRNTREFGTRTITNVVRDSVATTAFDDAPPTPQSVAYVDERMELFTYTPDRLILLLDRADDLRLEADTLLGGERHRVVSATVAGGRAVRVGFNAGTGLASVLWFRAGHPNDFGLVPWGEMDVEVWYSAWADFGDIHIPTQWDVLRVGRPYKRMTVLDADLDPELAPGFFDVSPELRRAFLQARRPMHDRNVDSVTVAADGLLQLHGFGFPTGAVRVGREWILLEAGHAPLSLTRGVGALTEGGMGRLSGAVVVAAHPGNGGVATLVERGVPVYTSTAARPQLAAALSGRGLPFAGIEVVDEPRSVAQGQDTLRLIPVDLADLPGALVTYVARLEWAYAPDATTALDRRLVLDRLRGLGLRVGHMGWFRTFYEPVAEGSP